MTGRGGGGRQRISIAPINYIFESLKTKQTLAVSLVEQKHITIEGILEGFDEFMNLVLKDAVEVREKTKTTEERRRNIGEILLKGDNVCMIRRLDVE